MSEENKDSEPINETKFLEVIIKSECSVNLDVNDPNETDGELVKVECSPFDLPVRESSGDEVVCIDDDEDVKEEFAIENDNVQRSSTASSKNDQENFIYGCIICDFKTMTRISLMQHVDDVHSEKHSVRNEMKCAPINLDTNESSDDDVIFVKEEFTNGEDNTGRSRSATSMEDMGTVMYECIVCTFKTTTRFSLRQHMAMHDEKNEIQNMCNYRTYVNGVLQNTIAKRRFSCSLCEYGTYNKSLLSRHMAVHVDHKLYCCEYCAYKTGRKRDLMRHTATRHSVEKRFACELCKYRTNDKRALKVHSLVHSKEKPVACDFCEYRTCRKRNLFVHIAAHHSSEKMFACNVCKYQTNYKASLKSHMLIHTNARPFACDKCDFRTCIKRNLVTHITSNHVAEKKFACNVCDYRTNNRIYFKSHMLVHTCVTSLSCEYCDYKTLIKGSLARHLAARHPNGNTKDHL